MPSFIRRLSIRRKSISRRLSLNDRTRASLRKNKDIQKFGVSSIIFISVQVRFGSDLYYGHRSTVVIKAVIVKCAD